MILSEGENKMKLKKGLMSALAVSLTVTLCGGMTAAQAESNNETAEDLFFVNDGYIELSGNMKLADEDDAVILTVVSGGKSDSSVIFEGENIVYAAEDNADNRGAWRFGFALDKPGRYKAYIGSNALDENEVVNFSFIDKEKFDNAAKELLAADSTEKIAEIIKKSAVDLGIFNSDISNYNGLAKIIKKEIEGKTELNPAEESHIFQKCCLVTDLNDKKLSSLKEYKEILAEGKNAYEKYMTDTVLNDICENLSGKAFDSIAKFDAALKDAVIVSSINNGSADTIKNVLSDYSNELGITDAKITDSLAEALTKQNFSDIEALKTYIKNPKNSSGSGSSGSSGGSGGSGGSGSSFGSKNTYGGKQAEIKDSTDLKPVYAFDDIADVPWAVEAITQLSYRGVLNGKEYKLFMPNDNITREEFAKVITVGFKLNLVDAECPFKDVSENDWAYKYIRSAYIAKIVNGISDTEFGYGQNITREDLCVMIERTLKAGDLTVSESKDTNITFDDDEQISDYARESVYYLAGAGIVSGDGRNFNPKAYATRAEAAKIIYLALVKTNR